MFVSFVLCLLDSTIYSFIRSVSVVNSKTQDPGLKEIVNVQRFEELHDPVLVPRICPVSMFTSLRTYLSFCFSPNYITIKFRFDFLRSFP